MPVIVAGVAVQVVTAPAKVVAVAVAAEVVAAALDMISVTATRTAVLVSTVVGRGSVSKIGSTKDSRGFGLLPISQARIQATY